MMKEETVLGVLMHLFQYYMKDQGLIEKTDDDLLPQLEKAGFQRSVIIQALKWLSNLSDVKNGITASPSAQSFRVFSAYECQFLDRECQAFILSLESQGILVPAVREIVIEQVLQLEQEGIDIGLIKWVALMVLFSQPEQQKALSCMEFLVLHDNQAIESIN